MTIDSDLRAAMLHLNDEIQATFDKFKSDRSRIDLKMNLARLYFVRAHKYADLGMFDFAIWDMSRFLSISGGQFLLLAILDLSIWYIRVCTFSKLDWLDQIRRSSFLEPVWVKAFEALKSVGTALGNTFYKNGIDRGAGAWISQKRIFWHDFRPRAEPDSSKFIGARVVESEARGGGRKVVATRKLTKHQAITVKELPAIAANDHVEPHCTHCAKKVMTFVLCPLCRYARFCSAACMKAANDTYHRALCSSKTVRDFDKMAAVGQTSSSNLHLCVARAIGEAKQQGLKCILDLPYLRCLTTSNVVAKTCTIEHLMAMCVELGVFDDPGFDCWKLCVVMSTVLTNAFGELHFTEITLSHSMFNHSCLPNAEKRKDTIVAIRAIDRGEEITIDYNGRSFPTHFQKKANLYFVYGFECDCAKCRKERDAGSEIKFVDCDYMGEWIKEHSMRLQKHIVKLLKL